jgi:HNH endonuclease
MVQGTCSVDGCKRPIYAKGWCNAHYNRNRLHGDPLGGGPSRSLSIEARFKANIRKMPNGCWIWQGAPSEQGYGSFTIRKGFHQRAHRWAYQMWVGPIPDGMTIDHLCHNAAAGRGECAGGPTCIHRLCQNPLHLEPVSNAENARRSPTSQGNVNRAKTVCKWGHEMTPENTMVTKTQRVCRACKARWARELNQRNRDKAARHETPSDLPSTDI